MQIKPIIPFAGNTQQDLRRQNDAERRDGRRMAIEGGERVSTEADTQAMLANPKFQKLVRTRAALGWTLAAIMFVVYFGFILLVAFNKDDGHILSQVVVGKTTSLAIVAGMGLLLFTFILTAFYVVIANSSFDRLIREIRSEAGR